MIKTRGRKILRDVIARKGRTILVSVSIMIGVFGAVTLLTADDLILKQITKDIRSEEIPMIRLYVTVPTAGTEVDNAAYLEMLGNLPGVTDVEGQVMTPVFWQKPGSERFAQGQMMAFSEPFGQINMEPMRLIEGEWPQPGQNQVLIERRMADENNLAVGDKVTFRVMGTQGSSGAATEEWTVAGIAFQPYWVDDSGEPQKRFFASYEDAQHIAGFTGFSAFVFRYIDKHTAWDQADELEETIAEETNYIPRFYWTDDPDHYFLIDEVKGVTDVLNILALVSLVVSGFLVMNVVSTIIVEQKRQIGVLKSIGATRGDNFLIYAGIALVYGIIGTVPGVLLGMLAGSFMAQELAPLAGQLIEGFHVSTLAVIVGGVMGLLVPVAAALIPVLNGARVSIREAMTDLGIGGTWGRGPVARLIKLLPLPLSARQAASNVVQKKSRLALTVITLTLAAAAFMGVFAMFTVVSSEIDDLFDTFSYDLVVVPTEAQDYDLVSGQISKVEGVQSVDPAVSFDVQFIDLDGTAMMIGSVDDTEIEALGIDTTTEMLNFTYEEGTGWQDDPTREGIVITNTLARDLDKKLGDQLLVSAGGQTDTYEVIGVASYPFAVVFFRWQDLATLAGFVQDGEPLPTVFVATLEEKNPSATTVSGYINEISDRLLGNGIAANYANQVEEEDAVAESLLTFNMIFQITSAVMAAVGAIGLLTTLSMAVFERQKEIGVMRSIGARSRTIIGQFEVEGILIGVLAWAIAIPLSYGLAVLLMDAMEFSEFIEFQYPVWVLFLGLGGMVIIAGLASLWPSLAASRRTVSDILRYQ